MSFVDAGRRSKFFSVISAVVAPFGEPEVHVTKLAPDLKSGPPQQVESGSSDGFGTESVESIT
jgi:hypothetical protein